MHVKMKVSHVLCTALLTWKTLSTIPRPGIPRIVSFSKYHPISVYLHTFN